MAPCFSQNQSDIAACFVFTQLRFLLIKYCFNPACVQKNLTENGESMKKA